MSSHTPCYIDGQAVVAQGTGLLMSLFVETRPYHAGVDEVLRDRRHLAGDGLVVPVVIINGQTGEIETAPEIITRGLASDPRQADLLRECPALLRQALNDAPIEERTDPGLLKERVRLETQRIFRKRAGRRPLVLPVVMEI